MPEKTKAAQMLGLSESWVEALRNGSKSFEDIAQGAEAAGAVIAGATVAKAAAFDRAWKQSSAQLAAQFKSTAADIGGWLDDLIGKAGELVKAALESQNIQSGRGSGKLRNRQSAQLAVPLRLSDPYLLCRWGCRRRRHCHNRYCRWTIRPPELAMAVLVRDVDSNAVMVGGYNGELAAGLQKFPPIVILF
ncbi:hypothetical protein GGD66_007904 [Bradyrhizobium sp. CIR48]|nr:hypothetical protein [Bradyrhizobium sp. CIR18]MBB4429302.1 hypothetical protein [Bradyrhizobium sp. CIR48]